MKRGTVVEYVVITVLAVLVALAVQAWLIKPYRIPSESMAATLVPRDRVLVNRVVYRLHAPGRGDIVVIDSAAVGRILIKRVVALPGETISVDGGAEYPHYTRPAEFRGWEVPEVLRSGHHAAIERWRAEQVRKR